MTIKKILVPLIGRHARALPAVLDRPALDLAFVAGRALDAHVEVFCIEAPAAEPHAQMASWLPGAAVDRVLDAINRENAERRARAAAAFEAAVARHQAPRAASPDAATGFCVDFLKRVGEIGGSLAIRGRLADLIVAAKSEPADGHISPLLEVALRETGRPVLIAPAKEVDDLGRRVVLAWNGSAEASRAVALAHPFLERATEVVVVSVCEDGPVMPGGDELAAYLRWHGISAQTVNVEGTADTAGEILLAEADKGGADLLVMGAYSRSRMRRLIFGGATSDVLDQATLPVLMVG